MLQEILKTGGTGFGVPMIQNAVASSRSGLSQSLESAKAKLAQLGLGDDPSSQAMLSQTAAQGEQQIAGIGPDLATQIALGIGPGLVSGFTGQALGGLGSAASLTGSNTTTGMSFDSGSLKDLGSLLSLL